MDRERTDRLDPIRGNPPSPLRHPSGCVFNPRCNYTKLVPDEACFNVRPELLPSEPDHFVRCHIPAEKRREIAAEVLQALAGPEAKIAGAPPATVGPLGSGAASSVAGVGGPQ
jgi:oligopeptide/dipeptide ABC transporter ATP-binding protein